MDDQQTVQFIIDIFDLIKKSKTILDLESIPDKMSIPIKNRMNIDGYPKIEYKINQAEIKSLLDNKILDNDLNFTKEITSKLTDPLTKLLYAISWKNGDLKKVKHIVRGILDSEKEDCDQDEALVFYQFGKYLTKTPGQPIIDQHVIRAFAIYKLTDIDQTKALRQIEIIDKRHKIIIRQYKEWLTSDELTHELKNETDYAYHIDKLLFATGKTIKNRS
jgi:hypothetical protein